MRAFIFLPLALSACTNGETNLLKTHALDDGPGPGEATGGSQHFEPTIPAAIPCPDDTTVDWELELAWEVGHPYAYQVAHGRVFDTTGDGVVDRRDTPVFVSSESEGAVRAYFFEDEHEDRTIVDEAWRSYTRLANTDHLQGAEVVVSWYLNGDSNDRVTVVGEESNQTHLVPENSTISPWVADFDHDGSADIAVEGRAVHATTGTVSSHWGRAPNDTLFPVAVDLDGDGEVENLSAVWEGYDAGDFGIVDASGHLAGLCFHDDGDWTTFITAVGNLDRDPDGEFVVAAGNRLVVCDTNGSARAETTTPVEQPALLAIGNLDADPEPEIVLSGRGIYVYDHHLNPLWAVEDHDWLPSSLADLDADGVHEVLVTRGTGDLEIYNGEGRLLTEWRIYGRSVGHSWRAQPVVADVDLDGLAEIIVPGAPTVVLENGDGWAGVDHIPGSLSTTGSAGTTSRHWESGGHNGWNARPTCVPVGD